MRYVRKYIKKFVIEIDVINQRYNISIPKGASNIEFNAKNDLGAKVGDKVEIEKENDAKLFGATLVFLVPLFLIVLSAFITYVFLKNEIWLLILSVIFIVLWYTILAVIDKKLKNLVKFSSVIVEIKEKN